MDSLDFVWALMNILGKLSSSDLRRAVFAVQEAMQVEHFQEYKPGIPGSSGYSQLESAFSSAAAGGMLAYTNNYRHNIVAFDQEYYYVVHQKDVEATRKAAAGVLALEKDSFVRAIVCYIRAMKRYQTRNKESLNHQSWFEKRREFLPKRLRSG